MSKKRKLVRFLYKAGCNKLSHITSPSLYYHLLFKDCGERFDEGMKSVVPLMKDKANCKK